ncbi:FecR domain-containing protein [Paraflavitalea speifideaquila]|uniref:FecR domain-containing protein n=1 Tax=Paraflavitalea speifideaquila TaxID=3076558 RepID=UPI0028F0D040|nr:FecR domain-containing protein [Paraflavitalea speifideiaquila]
MYDLPIHYDRQAFEHCYINITLGNEKLEEKLAVITQTINASFTLSDKGIKIEGTGCK